MKGGGTNDDVPAFLKRSGMSSDNQSPTAVSSQQDNRLSRIEEDIKKILQLETHFEEKLRNDVTIVRREASSGIAQYSKETLNKLQEIEMNLRTHTTIHEIAITKIVIRYFF